MVELIPFFGLIFYLLPFSVAVFRNHDTPIGVLVVNLLLGWTILGWLAALAWAFLPSSGPSHARSKNSEPASHDRPRAPVMPRILHHPTRN